MGENIFYLNGQALKYEVQEDVEEDCRKMEHELVDAKSGKYVQSIDWSPYSCPSAEDIRMYLELGCPRREEIPTIGPINRQDLLALKVKRGLSNHRGVQLELQLF
jgi:hypothetical protein